ncbi:WD40 repeat-containing protein, putative [Bodo saltans]|uniref:WD40 repeat-containing protein, putative n=1 Tax=Bodo saltans TaxID=75058 RepID=A0A0S4J9X3_BODSA|nr:WD40 repeat-containing protein, putative [Bodo saltans]|eukprot:CUG88230.1 WD40 repeat-containing protein, putative [Bodo saltans]
MTKGSDYAAMMKAAIIEENRRKVQRRKEEKMFVKGLQSQFQLSHLATIRDELSNRAHVDDGKFSSRPPTPSPPREDPTRCVSTFEAAIRCLEVAQGGASLWTGELDGSIGVRNGVTGDFAYRLLPVDHDGQLILVDALHASGNNMFVGCSDGSIRVYDVLVFVLAFEAKEHASSVCGFATTFDQRTFSISADGSLCKWDNESSNFNLISKADQEAPLRCVATYGYNVFAGTEQGPILSFDTDTLELVRSFDGHASNVTCLAIQDGYLFSGSSDTNVIVWNIATGEALKTLTGHNAGVSCFFCDATAHRLWSADLHGILIMWCTLDEESFPLMQTCHTNEECEVFSLKGITVLDAAKVWTLGSNGVNKVWHTSVNRVEDSIRSSITTMQGIIEQDEVELAKWDELTKTLQNLATRMNARIGNSMGSHSENLLSLRYFLDWLHFIKKRRIRAMQMQLADLIDKRHTDDRRREALRTWQKFAAMRIDAKKNQAVSSFLRSQHDQRTLSSYGRKLQDIFLEQQRKDHAARKSLVLRSSIHRVAIADAFRKLENFRVEMQVRRKRRELAAVLEVLSTRRKLCSAFCDWRLHASVSQRMKVSVQTLRSIVQRSNNGLMKTLWCRWRKAAQTRQGRNNSLAGLLNIAGNVDQLLAVRVFRQWLHFALQRRQALLTASSTSNNARIGSLELTLQSMGHLIQRRSLLDEADELIQRALHQRDSKRATAAALQKDIDDLSVDLERKKNRAPVAVEKTLQEQVADLLSLLKCRLLNFFSDFAQMQRVAEKTRRVGAQKVFLEAHQAVKRVVVEMTKEGYLPSDKPWPLSDKMIVGMKSHHTEVVLGAIKTMIMAYDALDVEQRSSLTSDEEVVVNAQNLHLLADRCLAARAKRMRR